MKLWGGRFQKDTDQLVNELNASIGFDQRLYREDITGSMAHAAMLADCGIISKEDAAAITSGLEGILADIEAGKVAFTADNEDIHMNVEALLTARIGDAGKRLHTARSRNDQVALDFRMYVREQIPVIVGQLLELETVLCRQARKYQTAVMPGYTHLQRAQPISFAQHLMAYAAMFRRDVTRLEDCKARLDECPLGSGALAGTTYPIDRWETAQALGFEVESVEISPTEAQRQATMERFEAAGLLPSEEDTPEVAAEKQAQLDHNLAPDSARAVCTNGAVVTASRGGGVRIELSGGFDAALDGGDVQAYAAAVQQLADEYGTALGMQAPQAAVRADYAFDGALRLTHAVWDSAAPLAQQLAFASCGQLSFSTGEGGTIFYKPPQLGEALGEYPLLSQSEAQALLLQGQCLAGAPYAVQSEADIAAVQLCYREGSEVYAPWYRFWVKLPEAEQQNCAEGCTAYGAYYVPAVSGQFAADLPGTQWDYSAPAAQSGPYGG